MSDIKKIFSMDTNFELKNFIEYIKVTNIRLTANKGKHRIFFLDAASYHNLGDQAIALAIYEFIHDNFKVEEYIEVSDDNLIRNLSYLKKNMNLQDVICLSGGGNMGNIYPRYESIRRKVIKSFPENKIVIFPQTIDFENNLYGRRELYKSANIYNSHSNLIICAREKKSFDIMQKYYKNVILVPDIVFYLNKRLFISSINNRNRTKMGICLRGDRESILKKDDKILLESILKNKYQEIHFLSTMSSTKKRIDQHNRRKILEDKFEEFSQCKLIVTDRLHGMIFSIITQTPCLIIDNSNGKVLEVYKTIRNNVNYIDMLERIEENYIEKKIQNILQKNKNNMIDIKEMYSGLINKINIHTLNSHRN